MTLKIIRLLQYRNYSDTTFPIQRHTIFIGPNGSGKTNVIEAIRTLSVTKSYRVMRDTDAIQWGEQWCRIELEGNDESFEYILTREDYGVKKVIKHNGVAIPLAQVYGLVPTVLFSPETMSLIDGSPVERRRFLDTILSQSDPDYIANLLTYRKVTRERHFVLLRLQQGLGNDDELEFWDAELLKTGTAIIEHRQAFTETINRLLKEIYPSFVAGDQREVLQISYKPSVNPSDLAKRLKAGRPYDIKTGATNIGPHRDELVFLLNDRDVTLFASRGEMRRSILATKLAEALYLKDIRSREPLLLLDDVFSELDELRRANFLEAISGYHSIITTTDEAFIARHALQQSVIHRLPLLPRVAGVHSQKG